MIETEQREATTTGLERLHDTVGVRLMRKEGMSEPEIIEAIRAGLPPDPTRENPRCDGQWHVWYEGLAPQAARCNCAGRVDGQARHWAERLRKMQDRLGHAYTWEAFDRDSEPEAFPLAETIRATWGAGGYLTGGTGNGKTHLLKALVYEALKQRKRVEFVHGVYLARMFQAANNNYSETSQAARLQIAALASVSVLAIDDLGSHPDGNETFEAEFQLLLDSLPETSTLLISTNLSPVAKKGGAGERENSDLERKVGTKNASRIGGRCALLRFIGRDRRAKAGSKALAERQP